jgi:hypothetical protein
MIGKGDAIMIKTFALCLRNASFSKKFCLFRNAKREEYFLPKLPRHGLIFIIGLCSRIFVCLVIIATALFIIAQPVWAEDAPIKVPRLELLPNEGPVGTEVFVRILDFDPNKQVIVIFGTGTTITPGTTVVAKETTDEDGYAVASFAIDLFGGGRYNVLADDGTNKIIASFKITPKITLSDTSGFVGDTVSVSGNGFAASKPIKIYLGDTKLTTGDANDSGIFSDVKFIVPESSKGEHEIKVEDSEGNSKTAVYTIKQKMAISPLSASVSSNVTVSGTGFKPSDITIYFDDKDIAATTVDSNGNFTAIIKVPPCADGTHSIKVDDGLNRSYCELTIISKVIISPDNGHVGMAVGIQGSGFRPGFPITINFDNTTMDVATVSTDGIFSCNFKIPKGLSGSHTISVTDGVNTKKTAFNIESTPPLAPSLNLPADSERIEKGVHFEWSGVDDPSGVTYVLEIAKDAKFSERILSTADLTQCAFDLPADENLLPSQNAPYYWRVKAIDGASNEGPWSSVGSFYKGYSLNTIFSNMPDSTKYILIGLGVVLVAFVFFWFGHVLKKVRRVDDSEFELDKESSNTEATWDYNTESDKWNQ